MVTQPIHKQPHTFKNVGISLPLTAFLFRKKFHTPRVIKLVYHLLRDESCLKVAVKNTSQGDKKVFRIVTSRDKKKELPIKCHYWRGWD